MSTKNPKISAYVPQAVFDCFNQFKEERGLSFSQTVIEILVDYFGIDLSKNSTEQSTSGLSDRVASLEKELVDLKQSYVWLVQKVESMQTTSEPLLNNSNIEVAIEDNKLLSDLPSEPQNNLLAEDKNTYDSSLTSEPPRQLPLIQSNDTLINELLGDIKNNPLQGKLLSKRLNVSSSVLSGTKSSLPVERFYDWIQEKDSDGIRWVNLGEGRSKGYVPADDTPLEKLQALKNWIQSHV
jgi:hypothetical protein